MKGFEIQGMHIHIVTLENDRFMPSYLVNRLAGLWREQGHRVDVGPSSLLDADIGIMNIDRTRVPVICLPDNPEGRPLLNAAILDISKRRISKNILRPDSGYTGPVIIKTDANAGGWPEWAATSPRILRGASRLLGRALSWRLTRQLVYGDYPVLNDPACVPPWVWQRDDLVVERFIPEREADEYVLRSWLFFGDQEYGVKIFSRFPVVKVRNATRHEYVDEVPDTIRQARVHLDMDFGKMDYVIAGDEAILLDVNKTPTVSAASPATDNLRRLASGLSHYLKGVK